MPTINGGTVVVTLEGKDLNLTELINKVDAQMKQGVQSARQYDTTIANLGSTQQRVEASQAAFAQSLARTAVAAGDDAQAVKILASALQQLTPNTTAANNVLTQLQSTLNRQTQAAQQAAAAQSKANVAGAAQASAAEKQQLSFATNSVSALTKLATAYFAVTQAAQVFTSAIEAGNTLEKTQATFEALSGSTQEYQKNLAAAREQQAKFGGSLQDNIEGLSSFANLSRRTGIDIKDLANTARALAVIDPVQGFKGAGIALKEFFSGDIVSLARRFEIPKQKLNELKELAQTDAPAAFRKLQAVLAEFGIDQGLLEKQTQTTAIAYDKLKGSAADAFAAIGQGLAQVLKPAAEFGTKVLTDVANGLNSLNQAGDQKLAIEETLIRSATNAEQFNAKVGEMNTQIDGATASTDRWALILGPLGPLLTNVITEGLKFSELTSAQLQFAQASLQAGTNLETIKSSITALAPAFSDLENVFNNFPGNINATAQEFNNFQQAALNAASASAEGATFAIALTNAVRDGQIEIGEATLKLQGYVVGIAAANAQQQLHAVATNAAATEEQFLNKALQESAEKTLNSAVATAQLKDLQAELASIAGAVASGHLIAGNAAVAMAAKYNIAIDAAARLISLQLQLAGLGNNGIPTSARRRGQEGGLLGGDSARPGKDNIDAAKANLKFIEDQKRRTEEQTKAEVALAKAKGDTKRAIDLLRGSQKGLNKDSAEFKNIEADIIGLESGKGRKGGGGTKSPKLTENEKLHNSLLAQEDKFNNQMEDLEQKHQANLLKIIQDFAKKQLETQKQNEILKRRSRFDFYNDLRKSQLPPVDKAKFAAAYEEAFAESQKIAQSGKAKLAQEFLDLRQKQIKELEELAQEEANIRSDKDIDKKEKERQLAELEARRKLLLDAQAEEQKQLLEGGDKNQNEFNERIAEENQAYAEQADKIAEQAGRASDAKIAAAERAKKAVNDENKALADQYDAYKKIADLNGGTLPQGTAAPSAPLPAPAASTPIQAPQPIPVTPSAPLPIAPGGTPITVQGAGMFIVRDQGVIDALGDQTARLEAQLGNLNAAVSNMNVSLGGKIDGVRSAVSSWKGGSAIRP